MCFTTGTAAGHFNSSLMRGLDLLRGKPSPCNPGSQSAWPAAQKNVIHCDIRYANLHQSKHDVLRVLDLDVALSGRRPGATSALHIGTPSYIKRKQLGFNLRDYVQLLTGKLP